MKVILPALLAVLVFAGCATGPKIDWTARVGNFTYDQAVLELGPPDKSAKLASGVIVADWITRPGYPRASVGPPVFYGYYPGAVIVTGYAQGYTPTYFLRLTFGADGKLTAWKKFAR